VDVEGIVAIVMVFGIPMLAIWTGHQRKMAELRLRTMQTGDTSLQAAVDGLREDLRTLRDTTMQYDLSFDAALQRMETRMGSIESKVREIEDTARTGARIG
jgi:hypothetical protein